MPKILFIASHRPERSPSQRYRFEQYLPFLIQNGYSCDYSFLISERDDQMFYQPGNFRRKTYFFLKSVYRRLRDLSRKNEYDLIFVQREAFMTGSAFFEKRFGKAKAKLVFDFDDAIWHLDVSDANRKLSWLKNPAKTANIIAVADLVLAGNDYLAAYALQYNKHVKVIPTTVDTDEYKRSLAPRSESSLCIGWSGSLTTIKHFEYTIPALAKLKAKYGNKIHFKVIGDSSYVNATLGIKGIAWSRETELKELSEFDIGIMPLPDDEWTQGKCGLKGLVYMAMEIPAVMSPVGVNTQIVQDGVNGFLASGIDEWVDKISKLIDSPELRHRIGQEGRKIVLEKYSVKSQEQVYLSLFNGLLGQIPDSQTKGS
jgi:glycosyltransferase involved in cell wall biosynthesis